MNRFKRLLGIFLIVLLCAALLAGCAKNAASPTPSVATPTPGTTGPVEDEFFYPLNIDTSTFNGKKITVFGAAPLETDVGSYYMLKDFQEEYGVTFEYIARPAGDVSTKLTMLVATNQAPTLLDDDNAVMPMYAARGLLEPIDEWINEQDPLLLREIREAYTWNGKRFAIQATQGSTFRSVIYNQQAFEDAGLEDPWERYIDEGAYEWDQLFDDSAELRMINDAGEITNRGWTFTSVDLGFALGLNDADFYTQESTPDGMKFTLRQDDPKVQRILQMFDDAVQANKIDYQYLGDVKRLVSGEVRMYNQVFHRSSAIMREYPDSPKLRSVPLPNGPDAQGEFKFGLVPWFNMIGRNSPNPEIAYYWCWWRAGAHTPNYPEGVEVPTDDVLRDRYPENCRYTFDYVREVQSGMHGEFKVVTNIEDGVPGLGLLVAEFCNDVYRDRGSISAKLTEYTPRMTQALNDLPTAGKVVNLVAEPRFPTINFAGGMPASIVPNANLPNGGSVKVVGGALVVNLPTSLPSDVDDEGEAIYPYYDLFAIKDSEQLFPAYNNNCVKIEYTCEKGGYDIISLDICYVYGDGTTIDNRAVVQSMEESGSGLITNWVHQEQAVEGDVYLVFRVSAYDVDADGAPVAINFAITSIEFYMNEVDAT